MKKLLISLFCAVLALDTVAQTNDYLTFRTKDGTELSLPVDGLKITFDNQQLHAVVQGQKADFNLSDMGLMFFSETPTAIEQLENSVEEVAIVNGRLEVNAGENVRVSVFTIDGRLVEGDCLSPGIYVVNVNGRTYKVLSR